MAIPSVTMPRSAERVAVSSVAGGCVPADAPSPPSTTMCEESPSSEPPNPDPATSTAAARSLTPACASTQAMLLAISSRNGVFRVVPPPWIQRPWAAEWLKSLAEVRLQSPATLVAGLLASVPVLHQTGRTCVLYSSGARWLEHIVLAPSGCRSCRFTQRRRTTKLRMVFRSQHITANTMPAQRDLDHKRCKAEALTEPSGHFRPAGWPFMRQRAPGAGQAPIVTQGEAKAAAEDICIAGRDGCQYSSRCKYSHGRLPALQQDARFPSPCSA